MESYGEFKLSILVPPGTQRTEQSEVYGTKKEEKREKRRKLV